MPRTSTHPDRDVRRRVQRVGDRRAVRDHVVVRRDGLGVGSEAGDREREVAAADHALGRQDALVGPDQVAVAPGQHRARVPRPVDVRPAPGRRGDRVAGHVVDVDGPGQRRRQPRAEADAAGDGPRDDGRVQLRQPRPRHLARDARQQVVERGARAIREARVAVARDRAQEDRQARPEARVPARDERLRRRGIDVREVEAPGEQLRERLARLRGHRQRAVLAEHGDADRAGVEPLRMRADDVALDPAVAALVDGAEPVDEEVVADVVPAVPLDVEELDRPHDRGRLRRRVAVGAGRVVDESQPQRGRERRPGAADLLVRVPAFAGDDRGRARLLERPGGHAGGRAPDEPGSQACDGAADAVLDSIGGADPPRVPEPPPLGAGALVRARVRPVLELRSRVLPRAPAAGAWSAS